MALSYAPVASSRYSGLSCVGIIPLGLARDDREIGTEMLTIVRMMILVGSAGWQRDFGGLAVSRLAVFDRKSRSRSRDQ